MGEKEELVCDACGKEYVYATSFLKHLQVCPKRIEAVNPGGPGAWRIGFCKECRIWRRLNKDHLCTECSLRKAGLKTWNEWHLETVRRWKAERKKKGLPWR